MKIKYRVDLTDAEREQLLGLIGKGKHGARVGTSAHSSQGGRRHE